MDTPSTYVKRLEDIENGKYTDIIFLVGPSTGTLEEVHASKVHVISSVQSLKQLIDEKGNNPDRSFRVEFDDVESFTLLIQFVMLSGRLVDEVRNLEQCVGLAAAAKKFELDVLGDFCKGLLLEKFLTLDNFWYTFDKHRDKSPVVYQATEEFFVKNSTLLLMGYKLSTISKSSLSAFLQFPNMQVDSEMELASVCMYYAMSRGGLEARELFRRVALPHLRLFTLKDPSDAINLRDYLEPTEKLQLIASLSAGGLDRVLETVLYNQGNPVQFSVQTTARKRKTPVQVDFLSRKIAETITLIYGSPWDPMWRIAFYLSKAQTKFELRFKAPRNMTVCTLETMRPIRLCHFNVQDIYQCFVSDKTKCRWQLPSAVSIRGSDSFVLDDHDYWTYFSWDTWQASIAVEKDTDVTVEVLFNGPCLFRRAGMLSEKSFHNIPFVIAMYERESVDSEWKEALDTGVNVIKCMSFYD